MKLDHVSKKVLITGPSGTGKSYLLGKLLKKEHARLKFVYDWQNEFGRRFGHPTIQTAEGLIQKTSLNGYVVYDPIVQFPGRAPEGFKFFCDYVFEVAQAVPGRKILVIEEIQLLTGNKEDPIEFLKCAETGRRLQLDMFILSQAPHLVHNRIRNQFTEIFSFQQMDKNAVGYLSEVGFPVEKIQALQGHNYLWRNLRTGEKNFEIETKTNAPGAANTATSGDGK